MDALLPGGRGAARSARSRAGVIIRFTERCIFVGRGKAVARLLRLQQYFLEKWKTFRIEPRRFHDLRHTAASLLIVPGTTLHDVKEILGHSPIRLTADLYGHTYLHVQREIMSKREAALARSQNRVAPRQVSKAIS